MTTIAVKITSQAQANQLASIVHSNNVRTIDQDLHWDSDKNVYTFTTTQKPFVVGNIALFWLFPNNLHYNQYTSKCTAATLKTLLPEQYGTANELAQAFLKLG